MQNDDLLANIPQGWSISNDKTSISRHLEFKDFAQAWSFMNQVAQAAEELNHHPDWSNSWNKVDITLTTHDAQSLTTKDLKLAETINKTIT